MFKGRWHILCLFISSPAWAYDIFEYQGPYTKAHGGAGIIMSKSGGAVLHNPANLWSTETSDMYMDLSPSRISFKVTTPDPKIKPGAVNVLAPLLSLGASAKDVESRLSGGLIFIPTGAGTTTKVKDFPVSFAGGYTEGEVESMQIGSKFGLGIAYRFTPNLSAGLSLIQDYSRSETAFSIGPDPVKDRFAFQTSSRSVRPVLGLRYRFESIGTLGLVYQAASLQHYELKINAFDPKPQSFYRKNYRAAVMGFGLQLNPFGRFQPFGQYSYEKWVPATFVAQSPQQALAGGDGVEYLNAHSYILGSRFRLTPERHLAFSYSSFGKNKGAGIYEPDGKTIALAGRGGQDFESLDRKHFTGAIELAGKASDLLFYGSYIQASAYSPPDTPSAGFYEMTIIMVGASYVSH